MTLLSEKVYLAVKDLVRKVQTTLPDDVKRAILSLRDLNLPEHVKVVVDAMIRNVELAEREQIPICQDTGTHIFYVKLGDEFPLRSEITRILTLAVQDATREIPLRPNAVDPVTNRNTGTGVGPGIPLIDIELVPGRELEICYIARGGGCELPTRAFSVPPEAGWEKLKRAVLKLVEKYSRFVCSPIVVGVGVGATIEHAVKVAEKALYLRKIGERHPDPKIAELEQELLEKCNKVGSGIQGLRHGPTVLDIHIDYTCRHPATFAIAITFSCWVLRRGVVKIVPC